MRGRSRVEGDGAGAVTQSCFDIGLLCHPTLSRRIKQQVPFDCAQGRLSTPLRIAQKDGARELSWGERSVADRSLVESRSIPPFRSNHLADESLSGEIPGGQMDGAPGDFAGLKGEAWNALSLSYPYIPGTSRETLSGSASILGRSQTRM